MAVIKVAMIAGLYFTARHVHRVRRQVDGNLIPSHSRLKS